MSTLLLVHGGWSAGWVWDRLTPELDERNLSFRVIDLPGHGANHQRRMWSVSLADYVDAVVNEAVAINGPVISVGHSGGGFVVSAAAGRSPEAFNALVYVTGFLPVDGERLMSLARKDSDSVLAGAIRPDIIGGSVELDERYWDEALFRDCSKADAQHARERLQRNPLRPFLAKARLDQSFDEIPKHYILCTADRGLTPSFQKWMTGRYDLKSLHELDCGHMAAYAAPSQLAQLLTDIVAMEEATSRQE